MNAIAQAIQYSFFWIIFAEKASFHLFQSFGFLGAFLCRITRTVCF